jgi:hypothetical protein
MPQLSARRLPGVGACVAVVAAITLSLLIGLVPMASPPAGQPASWAGVPRGDVAAPQNASAAPTVTLLGGLAEKTGGWNLSYPVNFTVPAGGLEVLYAWALPGNFSTYAPPVLPSGLHLAASLGWEGMAVGNLSAGNYSTDITYAGWTNLGSVAVYGLSGDPTFQFLTASQENPHYLAPMAASLVLPSGGSLYLGVESTGGTWPVVNASFTTIDEQAAAIEGGSAGLIGRQSSNILSFDSVALTNGIVGVAVDANQSGPVEGSASLLASYSMTAFGWNYTFPLDFFVPVGVSQVIYLWSLGGNFSNYTPPVLPAGMTVAVSIGYAGIATGNLTSGSYTSELSYAGWVNTVSLAVYGVSGGGSVSFQVGSAAPPNPTLATQQFNLSLPSGAVEYLGVETTGGTWPVLNASLSPVDIYAWALRGGFTGDIGRQSSNVFSFTSRALTVGIVGIGIYSSGNVSEQPVTFVAAGLPFGDRWTIAVGGATSTTVAGHLTVDAAAGALPYLVSGPSGYRVTGLSPSGAVRVGNSPLTETVQFVHGGTVSLRFKQSGLPTGQSWCVVLSDWQKCSSGRILTYTGLTPATYSYRVVPMPMTAVAARVGHVSLSSAGMLSVARGETVGLKFVESSPVTFAEAGLPTGTSWSITVHGHTLQTTNSTLVVLLPVGSYSYRAASGVGYFHAMSSHRFRVSDAPLVIPVQFSP